MNAMRADVIALTVGSLIVLFKTLYLRRRLWNQPLNHGPEYFLGTAVPAGFYKGTGITWLRRYRAVLVFQYLLVVGVFFALVIADRAIDIPWLAPVDVITTLTAIGGFQLWSRRVLGNSPPVVSAVAVSLDQRRLLGLISWRPEISMLLVLIVSWALLLLLGDRATTWQGPLLMTWTILGLFPAKLLVARSRFPIPAERADEHYRWLEAQRVYGLRLLDAMRWVFVATMAGYAVLHGVPGAQNSSWVRWLLLGTVFTIWIAMVALLIRGGDRLGSMGRSLRPIGSWSGPLAGAGRSGRAGLAWGVVYCAGLAGLLVFYRG